jgi:hypothetical protein
MSRTREAEGAAEAAAPAASPDSGVWISFASGVRTDQKLDVTGAWPLTSLGEASLEK